MLLPLEWNDFCSFGCDVIVLFFFFFAVKHHVLHSRVWKVHFYYNDWLMWPTPAGLIIDAFGELRDQQEQVKEDMEVNTHRLPDTNTLVLFMKPNDSCCKMQLMKQQY